MNKRLLKTCEGVDFTAMPDVIYLCAKQYEDAMLIAGLVPGVDYQVKDLFELSAPMARQIVNERGSFFVLG